MNSVVKAYPKLQNSQIDQSQAGIDVNSPSILFCCLCIYLLLYKAYFVMHDIVNKLNE